MALPQHQYAEWAAGSITSACASTGNIITINGGFGIYYPPRAETALEWLDRRVNEMRVKL